MSRTELARHVDRFDSAERWLHWTNAALFAVCMATAATLYFNPLATLVGRRALVRDVHVVAGFALPAPFLIVLAGRWGRRFRIDVGELNRWTNGDWRWLRSFGRDPFAEVGKFNAGQKLNAAFTAGSIPLLLVTGWIMRWFDPFPLLWRTGATFVHDWTAFALVVAIGVHVVKALSDPPAMRAMLGQSLSPPDRRT